MQQWFRETHQMFANLQSEKPTWPANVLRRSIHGDAEMQLLDALESSETLAGEVPPGIFNFFYT